MLSNRVNYIYTIYLIGFVRSSDAVLSPYLQQCAMHVLLAAYVAFKLTRHSALLTPVYIEHVSFSAGGSV